jgi:hypothetical protein
LVATVNDCDVATAGSSGAAADAAACAATAIAEAAVSPAIHAGRNAKTWSRQSLEKGRHS